MKTKVVLLVSQGTEQAAAEEITKLTRAEAKSTDHLVFVETSRENICLLAYKAQTIDAVGELLSSFKYKDVEDLLKKAESEIKKINWKEWIDEKTTFRVTGITRDTILPREHLAAEVGGFMLNKNQDLQVNLEHPDLNILLLIINHKAYLAIDYAGRDLHKRDYKIFPNPASLRGTLAAALLRVAGWNPKQTLLDPFAHSGEICIEAALQQTNTSVNFYSKDRFAFKKLKPLKQNWKEWFKKQDEKEEIKKPNIYCFDARMPNVTAAKKNAKIAGINKAIQFSRQETEWLDTKLKKASIDRMITRPPEPSKFTNKRDLEKLHKELFYQAEYILNKKGTLTIIQKDQEVIKKAAQEKGFKILKDHQVFSGKSPLQVCVYQKE